MVHAPLVRVATIFGRPNLSASLALLVGAAACGDAPTDSALVRGRQYVESRAFRRAALEASIVDPKNGYSELRLSRYATPPTPDDRGWDRLPIWNPPVRPVTTDDIGAFTADPGRRSAGDFSVVHTGVLRWREADLLELGRRAFESYPISNGDDLGFVTDSRDSVDAFGLWVDQRGHVGGLVRTRVDSKEAFGKTCASCHARTDETGRLVHGAANARLEQGAASFVFGAARGTPENHRAPLLTWGPGNVDPTPDGMNNPIGITDLRPIRYQNHINVAATLENDLIGLAIRVETLMITSLGQRARPPREISFAIAYYLWSLGEPEKTPRDAPTEAAERGRLHFRALCSSCHFEDGHTAQPVPLEQVGTDPAAGLSPMRGTGRYRIPSLFKAWDRHRLLHRGQVGSLLELLDPNRVRYEPGHPFGHSLKDDERDDLIAFLKTFR